MFLDNPDVAFESMKQEILKCSSGPLQLQILSEINNSDQRNWKIIVHATLKELGNNHKVKNKLIRF